MGKLPQSVCVFVIFLSEFEAQRIRGLRRSLLQQIIDICNFWFRMNASPPMMSSRMKKPRKSKGDRISVCVCSRPCILTLLSVCISEFASSICKKSNDGPILNLLRRDSQIRFLLFMAEFANLLAVIYGGDASQRICSCFSIQRLVRSACYFVCNRFESRFSRAIKLAEQFAWSTTVI